MPDNVGLLERVEKLTQSEMCSLAVTGQSFVNQANVAFWAWNTVDRKYPNEKISDGFAEIAKILGYTLTKTPTDQEIMDDIKNNPDSVEGQDK